jgi:uncharacterized protein YjiS (DUF1127 family)
MNANFAKNHMAHLLPVGLAGTDADTRHEVGSGFGRKVANALAWLVAMPRRRAVIDELRMLTDRELADIGVARSELKRVFDPAFTRDHAVRTEAYRSLGMHG